MYSPEQCGDTDVINHALLDENMKTAVCADSTHVRGSFAALTYARERAKTHCPGRHEAQLDERAAMTRMITRHVTRERWNVLAATYAALTDGSRTYEMNDVCKDGCWWLKVPESWISALTTGRIPSPDNLQSEVKRKHSQNDLRNSTSL